MTSLSPELWHIVAGHLSIQDATQLRLVNRFFADIAGVYILPEVSFRMHQDDFARLRGIASNGILAANVRSLTYFTTEYKSPAVTFRKFKQHHENALKQQKPPLSMQWAREAKPADDLTLRSEYEKYERMVALQDQIRVDMADLACLKDVLAKFTGLRHVTMSSGSLFYEGRVHEKPSPFITAFPPPTQEPRLGGVRHLEVLLEALSHNKIRVQSLRAGLFDWTFFDKSPTELKRLFQPVLDADHCELEMSLDLDEDLHDIDGNTEICRDFMERGAIRGLLAHMRRLKLLRVGFLCDIDLPDKPVMLDDIMGPGHHWPHLEQLELSNVEANRHTLMRLLSLHKDTLQFLCLQDFSLGKTSWEKLLPGIRNNLHLEDACICGTLTGQVEDMPDKGSEEFWELNAPGIWENDMRASINCYCQNGGKNYPDEVPLTDEVVQKHFDQYVRCHVKMTQAEDWEEQARYDAERRHEVLNELREAGLIGHSDSEGSESGWEGNDSGYLDDLDDLDNEEDEEDEEDFEDEYELLGAGHSQESDGSDGDVD